MVIHKTLSKLVSKILAFDKWLKDHISDESIDGWGLPIYEEIEKEKTEKQEEPEKRNKARPFLYYLVYYGFILSFVVYGLLVVLSHFFHLRW